MEARLYSVTEAAAKLAELVGKEKPYNRSYILKLVKNERIEYRRTGHIIVFNESALIKFSKGHSTKSRANSKNKII